MSIVAAKYLNNRVIQIASDSYSSFKGNTKRLDSNKIATYGDEAIFGFAGGFTFKQTFVDYISMEKEIDLSTRLKLVKFMSDFRYFMTDHLIDPKYSSTMIIICKAGLFTYGDDGELTKYNDYTAIGIGRPAALGIMEYGGTPEDAVNICKKVIQSCAGETKKLHYKI